jgi:hypothetical protein
MRPCILEGGYGRDETANSTFKAKDVVKSSSKALVTIYKTVRNRNVDARNLYSQKGLQASRGYYLQWFLQPNQGPGYLFSSVIIFHRWKDSLDE